ncbi:unnamed protein product [Danaus chrysippus]|uniref:(African queen) hypothetical protein n=1 Tax=Danaus chrysippus TaxID=151541 RepID=A0A8J2VT96_9NEOP|nr:unnamed protein product [Danaus chrysippus]
MKTIIFLAVIAFAVADSKFYDVVRLDIDKMEKDPQEFKGFVDCLLDRGPCTPVYSAYRELTNEVTESICKKCSPHQKRGYWQFLKVLRTSNPEDYENFRQNELAGFFIIMKTIIFLAVIAFAVAESEFYDVVRLDMDSMEKDPKEFMGFVDCLLDRGPCTPVFKAYRDLTQEVTENICKKCNPHQKRGYWQFLRILRTTNPEDYENFRQKYDADNIYIDILESVLSGYAPVIAFAVAISEFYDIVTLDMDKMEKDPQEFKGFADCLLDRVPCRSVFRAYRDLSQEVTENICKKCNPHQKRGYWQFLRILRTTNPEDYEDFRQKYDADNIYIDILESVLNGYARVH